MKKQNMTSMERVLTTLGHQEPDRVPLFLLLTMHGAKELGLSIKEYFSKAEYVIEGQLRMREKYSNDCFYPFFYAPIEIEAFGAEVIFTEDGPPNSGLPFITDIDEIKNLEPPKVSDTRVLHRVLETIKGLKSKMKDEVPIIGVAMSPFSLPVMQMGFEKYLELMAFHPEAFKKLMEINTAFCVDWSNAQLMAGATAICYFDPVSSPSMITREEYLKTGYQVACDTIAKINGPTATHFASGRTIPIINDVATTGTAVIGVPTNENLVDVKNLCRGKLTILGNLNGIAMRKWSDETTEDIVRQAIKDAGPGGGFILSDNHGEIPFQVPEETLLTISNTVKEFGRYPIN
jgi:uroporphyrinogen decarboxylase